MPTQGACLFKLNRVQLFGASTCLFAPYIPLLQKKYFICKVLRVHCLQFAPFAPILSTVLAIMPHTDLHAQGRTVP